MKPLGVLICVALAGCASSSPTQIEGPKITAATAEQVAGCAYIDDLVVAVGLYGIFAEQGIASARGQVLQQAANRGATHIVWGDISSTYGQSTARGKAYRCG